MAKLNVSFEYSGFADYWSGNGRRWDDNAGCLFAYYGPRTTMRELVDQHIEDFNSGGDTVEKEAFDQFSDEDVRAAILDMLTTEGRQDYDNNAICEFALELAKENGIDPEAEEDEEAERDLLGDESPVVILLIEVEEDEDDEEEDDCVCEQCGRDMEEVNGYGLCDDCERLNKLDRPEPGDYTVTPTGPLGGLSGLGRIEGGYVGTFKTDGEAIAHAKTLMNKEQFWPNIWLVSDHGNWALYNG